MIDYKHSTTNNISFPSNTRKVMLLIDGEYYRMQIEKGCRCIKIGEDLIFNDAGIKYALYKEDSNDKFAYVNLDLVTNNVSYIKHELLKMNGHKEVPDDYFELKMINIDKNLRSKNIGTSLLNYVMSDITKFNKLQGKTLKVLFQRINSDVTLPFYEKFGARENVDMEEYQKAKDYYVEHYTPMIIDEPKPYGKVPLELADDYEYEANNQINPF